MNYLVNFKKNYRVGKLQNVDLYSITFTCVSENKFLRNLPNTHKFLQYLSEVRDIVGTLAIIAKETKIIKTNAMIYEYTITDVEDGKMDEELARFCENCVDATYSCESYQVF